MGIKAGLGLRDMDRCVFPAECKQHLTEAKEWLECLKRDEVHHRELFQEDQGE